MKAQNTLSYKGYIASINVSLEDNVIFGKVECINDLITFCAEKPEQMQNAFETAVDDYLETCQKLGREPNKVMSGTFNIRIGSERHKKLHIESVKNGTSVNDLIKKAIDSYFNETREVHNHNYILNQASLDKGANPIDIPSWSGMEKTFFIKQHGSA